MYFTNMGIALAALALATSCKGVGGRASDGQTSEDTLAESGALSLNAGGGERPRSNVVGQAGCQSGDTVGYSNDDRAPSQAMEQLAQSDGARQWAASFGLSPSYAVARDLDCNGWDDLLLIGYRRQPGGFSSPAKGLVFDWRNAEGDSSRVMRDPGMGDDLARPVLFADLDGDGVQDLVTRDYFAGGPLWSGVYLLSRAAISFVGAQSVNEVEETFHCHDMMRPRVRVESDSGSPILKLPVPPGEGEAVEGCRFDLAEFRVVSSALTRIDPQGG
jgi:hypothetical protein